MRRPIFNPLVGSFLLQKRYFPSLERHHSSAPLMRPRTSTSPDSVFAAIRQSPPVVPNSHLSESAILWMRSPMGKGIPDLGFPAMLIKASGFSAKGSKRSKGPHDSEASSASAVVENAAAHARERKNTVFMQDMISMKRLITQH